MSNNRRIIILIVDDSVSIRKSVRVILEKEGYYVREAGSEFGIMNKIEEYGEITDLILMDITLNEQDGFDLVGKLRKNEKHQNIPIIMLTQHSDRDHVLSALVVGVQGYLVKPVKPDILLEKIREIMGKNPIRT